MTQLTTRDWEALSAYIDGQIEGNDRNSLENRLQSEPELAKGLEELRATCLIIKSSPKYRAPRNFTLTPQMAGKGISEKHSFSLFPTLRLTAVWATFFFILVAGGNLFINLRGSEPIVVTEAQYYGSQKPMALGKGGGGGGGVAPAQMIAPTQESLTLQAEEASGMQAESALVVTPEQMIVSPTGTPDQPAAFAIPQEPQVGLAGVEEDGPAASSELPVEEIQKSRSFAISWIDVLQILLALLALGTGMAAFLVRKKKLD